MRNSIKPSAVSYLSMHWLLQGLADAAAGLPNTYARHATTIQPAARWPLMSPLSAKRLVSGLRRPPPLPIPSVASPDTHRRLKLNLRCVSGEATEG
jgi:hypothetical protein